MVVDVLQHDNETTTHYTAQDILDSLHAVKDPEIPAISVVDMGIITGVQLTNNNVHVSMTPTFVGCPAINVMRDEVEATVRGLGFRNVVVDVNFDQPWTTNRVTEAGKAALLLHGLAPPDYIEESMSLKLDVLNNIACPVCHSRDTTLKTPFGPTLCRSIHHCNACHETFEAFKPV